MNTLNQRTMDGRDGTSSFTSEPFYLGNVNLITLQGLGAGAALTGTLKVQATNQTALSPLVPLTSDNADEQLWSDLASATLSFTVDAAKITAPQSVCAQWGRTVWTFTSGTGSMTAIVNAIGPS